MEAVEKVKTICRVPSIFLGALHQGKVNFRRSLGHRDLENSLLADSDTIYLLGSESKAFLSTAAGTAVNEGSIEWNGV